MLTDMLAEALRGPVRPASGMPSSGTLPWPVWKNACALSIGIITGGAGGAPATEATGAPDWGAQPTARAAPRATSSRKFLMKGRRPADQVYPKRRGVLLGGGVSLLAGKTPFQDGPDGVFGADYPKAQHLAASAGRPGEVGEAAEAAPVEREDLHAVAAAVEQREARVAFVGPRFERQRAGIADLALAVPVRRQRAHEAPVGLEQHQRARLAGQRREHAPVLERGDGARAQARAAQRVVKLAVAEDLDAPGLLLADVQRAPVEHEVGDAREAALRIAQRAQRDGRAAVPRAQRQRVPPLAARAGREQQLVLDAGGRQRRELLEAAAALRAA